MRSKFVLFAVTLLAVFGLVNVAGSVHALPSLQAVAVASPSVASKIGSTWPWYMTRASGIVAAVSLVLLVVSGIGMITGMTYRFFEPLQAWAWHRAVGIAFGVSVLLHIFVLLFDKFAPFSIFDVLIPFLSKYQPAKIAGHGMGSLYIAFGVLAMYLVAGIIVTSLLWIDKKPHTWKLVHYASYAAILLVFFHALESGTDFKHGSFRFIWVSLGIVILGASGLRLIRAGTMRK